MKNKRRIKINSSVINFLEIETLLTKMKSKGKIIGHSAPAQRRQRQKGTQKSTLNGNIQ